MNTTGASPVARGFHTAHDKINIIVYGGENAPFIPAPDQLLDLDTNVQPFKWTIPSISITPNPAPFKGHTSTLVGDYMIVAFSWRNNGTGFPGPFRSNKLLCLNVNDANNYMWCLLSLHPRIHQQLLNQQHKIIIFRIVVDIV
ncbi:3832_t:CDS:2, partial [Gigaspora rosea]